MSKQPTSMKDLIEAKEKELKSQHIGDTPPPVYESFKDKTCFICGHPFDKSEGYENLVVFLKESMTAAYLQALEDAEKAKPTVKTDPENMSTVEFHEYRKQLYSEGDMNEAYNQGTEDYKQAISDLRKKQ